MLSYETLDTLADSTNPALGLIALIWPWIRWRGLPIAAVSHIAVSLLCVAVAYLFMALDAKFGWWAAMTMDFSTHTAICVMLTVALASIRPRIAYVWIGVMLAYFALMLYQRYHTLADILTTCALIVPVALAIRFAGHRFTSPTAAVQASEGKGLG